MFRSLCGHTWGTIECSCKFNPFKEYPIRICNIWNHAMTTSSLFHTDIQRLWKHSPFKVPADSLHLQMLQISMGIWFWHLLLSSHELIYTRTPEKIIIIIKLTYYHILFHFPHPHPHTHIQKTDINARTHTQNLKLTTTWPLMPWSLNRRSNRKSSMFALTWLCVCLDLPTLWTSCPHNDRKTWTPLLQRFFEEFKWGVKKRVTNVCLVDQFDPDTEKNIIYEKKTAFFFHTKSDTIQKRCILNEGWDCRMHSMQKNTHTHTHRHTHTHHTHTQHAHMVHILP